MLTKNKAKFIKSLQDKKSRSENKLFLVEGSKSILELFQSDFKINECFCTDDFHDEFKSSIPKALKPPTILTEKELATISAFKTNNAALALVEMKENIPFDLGKEWVLALDDIQDPGNLGTIIRIADWYGISKIICSELTVDWYNPKVIAASMGSFSRVNCYYTHLAEVLHKSMLPIFCAHLEGKNLHQFAFPEEGILVLGNESRGVDKKLIQYAKDSIMIPRFGRAESLNVGIATAVICDALRRK